MKTPFPQQACEVNVITSTLGHAFHRNSNTFVKLAQNLAHGTCSKYLWMNGMYDPSPAIVGLLGP